MQSKKSHFKENDIPYKNKLPQLSRLFIFYTKICISDKISRTYVWENQIWQQFLIVFAINDGYSDYFTFLLRKTAIQTTKIVLFLSMHTVQLTISYHKFLLLIGWIFVMETLWLHQKRNEKENNTNLMMKNKYFPKIKCKCTVSFVTGSSAPWPMM